MCSRRVYKHIICIRGEPAVSRWAQRSRYLWVWHYPRCALAGRRLLSTGQDDSVTSLSFAPFLHICACTLHFHSHSPPNLYHPLLLAYFFFSVLGLQHRSPPASFNCLFFPCFPVKWLNSSKPPEHLWFSRGHNLENFCCVYCQTIIVTPIGKVSKS